MLVAIPDVLDRRSVTGDPVEGQLRRGIGASEAREKADRQSDSASSHEVVGH
jgi:hypothetical protein